MKSKKKMDMVVIIGPGASPSLKVLAESVFENIVVAESVEEVSKHLNGTSLPDLKPREPFVLSAPKVIERSFEDYESGKVKRRKRRAEKRKKKKLCGPSVFKKP